MTVFPDHAAVDYDERIENLVPGYALALALFGCTLAGRINPQGTILVPGCGTGSEILALASVFPQACFTAVEPSAAMLAKARGRLQHAGIDHRTEFIHGFLEDAPQVRHDAATASLVLHFLPDDGAKASFLAGIARRLIPGAPLLLLDPSREADDRVLRRWLEGRGHASEGLDAICQRMDKEWHRIPRKRLADLLAHTGFTCGGTFFQAASYTGVVAERRRDD